MKELRKIIITIVFLTLIVIIAFAFIWVVYYYSIEKSNRESAIQVCKEDSQDNYVGLIQEIRRFEYDSYMNENFYGLNIRLIDDTSRTVYYQYYLPDNPELIDFVKEGDSIIKIKSNYFFTVAKSNNERRSFNLPTCK